MVDLPTSPNNREERYLASIAGQSVEVPECPWNRKEAYLDAINGRVESLQDELETLENNPDVADIVDTYADLEAYDTSTLTDKDIIRVLNDETHDGDSTYYRYSTATGEFTYIGTTKQYTDFVGTDGTTAGEAGLVPAPAATDAGKFLKADGTWDDVGTPINVVQTTGTSTTDVMSQNATTSMVFAKKTGGVSPSGAYLGIRIGEGALIEDGSNQPIAIGINARAGQNNQSTGIAIGPYTVSKAGIAIGDHASIPSDIGGKTVKSSVALGPYSTVTRQGEVNIGTTNTVFGYDRNSNYRVLGGLYPGQSEHDAATVGQLTPAFTNAEFNSIFNTDLTEV